MFVEQKEIKQTHTDMYVDESPIPHHPQLSLIPVDSVALTIIPIPYRIREHINMTDIEAFASVTGSPE